MDSPPKLGLGTIYITFTWNDWSYYKFRYGFEKVLDTQNRLTHESVSTHYVLHLNLIKSILNIAFYTHTHTLTYI